MGALPPLKFILKETDFPNKSYNEEHKCKIAAVELILSNNFNAEGKGENFKIAYFKEGELKLLC